jgi:membrane protease YdiL (CAAX protease family)
VENNKKLTFYEKEKIMYDMEKPNEQKLSIPMIIILGLVPGLVVLFLAFIFSDPVFGINFPVYLSLMLAIILGLIPTELGILKFIARKENKKIKDIILYKNKTPIKKLILSIIIPVIIAIIAFGFIKPYELKLWRQVNFLPYLFKLENTNLLKIKHLKITIILSFIFNGFIGPIVEEIYFRRFLLPRMGIFGKFAPLINSVIFSVYHFFTPRQIITRIVGVTPMVYSVWINKDIKIGLIVHCSVNVIGDLGLLMFL